MPLADHLEKLKLLLSEADLEAFNQLSQRLSEVRGDLSQLKSEEIDLIRSMEEKYGEQIRESALANADTVVEDLASETEKQLSQDEFPLLQTEFANYVKNMLLRELPQFSNLESAVTYAFKNKWIPQELKNPDICETLFERFFSDIEASNEWQQSILNSEKAMSNKTMAVGLTWFQYVYQLKQWVDKQA